MRLSGRFQTCLFFLRKGFEWFSLKITKFAISSRGPRLWNKILDNNTKAFTSYSLFQTTIKNRLIDLENVVLFF